MILDHRTQYFDWARSKLSFINMPFNTMLTVPVRIRTFQSEYWPNGKLRERVVHWQNQNQRLAAKVQKYEALEIEKNRLLVLLAASHTKGDAAVKIGRIIRTAIQGPYAQRIMIDRGNKDGVVLSQAVIDANGVIGQVSKVASDHSVVTVITDASHAVPVEVLRNGLNVVARGTGGNENLSIPFLSFQADIEVGDVLVTSGMGDVFPSGHPVAKIIDIEGVAGEQFLSVQARPFAELNKVKNILLLERLIPSPLPVKIQLSSPGQNPQGVVPGTALREKKTGVSGGVNPSTEKKNKQQNTALTSESIRAGQRQKPVQ